jgi:hypothetical protein
VSAHEVDLEAAVLADIEVGVAQHAAVAVL